MEPVLLLVVLLAVAVAFAVSASAGFGGSLILVPTLALVLGTKSGAALAALLLAANNVVKVLAYRKTLPFRKSAIVIIFVGIGTALGAVLFVAAPERVVTIAVIVSFGLAFLAERLDLTRLRRFGAPVLALGSGATSGFSGTSGPLKGLAVRLLNLDRLHMVGALSLASLIGDITKTAIWKECRRWRPRRTQHWRSASEPERRSPLMRRRNLLALIRCAVRGSMHARRGRYGRHP